MPSPLIQLRTAVAAALAAQAESWGTEFSARGVIKPTKPAKDCDDLELLVWFDFEGEQRETFSKSQILETARINISIVQRFEGDEAFNGLVEFSEKVIAHDLGPVIVGGIAYKHVAKENEWLQRFNPHLVQQEGDQVGGEFVAIVALPFKRVI